MLDLLDTAHPLVTTMVLMAMLVSLWVIQLLNQRIRVLENRLESLEREQENVDEELAMLSQVGGMSASTPAPAPSGDALLSPPSEPPVALPAEGLLSAP